MKKRLISTFIILNIILSICFLNLNFVNAATSANANINEETNSTILSNEQEKVDEGLNIDSEPSKGFKQESIVNINGLLNKNSKSIFNNESNTNLKFSVKGANILNSSITWEIEDGTLTISGNGEIGDFVYTEDLSQMPPWFKDERENIRKVVIEEGITRIGRGAFFGCIYLNEVVLPTTLKTIADYAFEATGLAKFTIPSNLESLSSSAFIDTEIEEFLGGSTKYIVNNGVIYIDSGKTLFLYPFGKTDEVFYIPNGVTKLAEESFYKAKYLKSVIIPDTVTEAEYYVFCRSNIESVKFGNGLKATSYQMFAGCQYLKDIDFGTGLQEIYGYTFLQCLRLNTVLLPANVTTVGVGSFSGCVSLTSLTTKGLKIVPFQAFYNLTSLSNVSLNEGITQISRSAFYGCSSLKEITIPKSVTFIHSLAFPKTTKITCKNTNMRKYGENGYRYLQDVKIKGERKYSLAFEVLKIVNDERKKVNLSELKMDESLLETAMIRAAENEVCFAHTRPDGSICFDLSDKMIAENVAIGQTTSKQVMIDWMNSEGHKENILLKDAKTIGIGCFVHNGIYCWAQSFGNGNNKSNCAKPKDTSKTEKIALATETFKEAITTTGVVYSESSEEYSYNFKMNFDKSTIEKNKTTIARIVLTNAGWQYAKSVIDNSSFTWSSAYSKTATVSSSGKITGKANGKVTIKAKLKHSKFSKKITIGKNSKTPSKMTISSLKAEKGKIMKVKWKKNSAVTGYQIRYSTNKNFTKDTTKTVNITKNSTTSKTIKKLTKGKKYYVQIRAYKTVKVDGVNQKMCGDWSSKKTITAKK